MHTSGSYLMTVVERIRSYLDSASLDAKYTDDWIVRNVVAPEMANVCSRLTLSADNPVRVRHSITLAKDTEYYQLPPNVGEVYRVAIFNDKGQIESESTPRGVFHPRGPNWVLEGNVISFRPFPTTTQVLDIFYIPNGDFHPIYADASTTTEMGQLNSDSTFVLSNYTTMGFKDRRENAYAGGTLRLLKEGMVVEERIISSFDANGNPSERGIVTPRLAFTDNTVDHDFAYEIVPPGFPSMWQAISAAGAIHLGTSLNITQKQMNYLVLQYKMAMKTIKDNLSNMQARIPKHYQKNTVDNNVYSAFI